MARKVLASLQPQYISVDRNAAKPNERLRADKCELLTIEMDKIMPPHRPYPARISDYVFVLWGDKFEEAEATIFATELRRAGLCVKLIGLAGRRATGVHGMVLLSDLTLGEAMPLASQAICIILPCSAAIAARIEDDPRILGFFEQANHNAAYFVLKQADSIEKLFVAKHAIPVERITTYFSNDDLTEFARYIAGILSDPVRERQILD